MNDIKPVSGTWWQPPPSSLSELQVTVLTDFAGNELVVSGGLLSQLGKVVKKTQKTVYVEALPVAGVEGTIEGSRKKCIIAITEDKKDAIQNAETENIWVLDEGEGEDVIGGATCKVKLPLEEFRAVAGLHTMNDTIVITKGFEMKGVICPVEVATESKSSKIKIGTCGDYPPLTIWSEEEGFRGFSVEFLEEGFKGEIEWVKTTWPKLHQGLLTGEYDVAFGGINESGERKRLFVVSEGVLPCGKSVLTRVGDGDKFSRFSEVDKKGVIVVTNPGGTNEKFCAQNLRHATTRHAPDNVSPFTDLTTAKADLMITDSIEALHRSHTTPTLTYHHTNPPLTPGHTVAIASHTPQGIEFIKAFNDYLNKPETNDVLKILTTKWLGSPLSRP